jgi:hypothetical protein
MKPLLFVPALVLLVGCSNEGYTPTQRNVQGGNIELVTLEDGTRCAVFDGFKAGGLSCDWEGNR